MYNPSETKPKMQLSVSLIVFGGGGRWVHATTLKEMLEKRGHTVVLFPSVSSFYQRNLLSFDLVHVHGVERLFPILFGSVFNAIPGKGYVITVHSFGPPSWYWNVAKRILMMYGMRKACRLICVSNFLRREFLSYCGSLIPYKKTVTIYNGVDTARFCPPEPSSVSDLKRKLGLEGKYIIFYAGRLSKAKNLPCLLTALSEIRKQTKDIVLAIASAPGVGGMELELRRISSRLGIEDAVKWLGAIPHERIHSYYGICDVFVLPSVYESLPLSILEAMSCGKPIVASNVGGIPELIVNGKNGYLVQPNKPEMLAKAILSIYHDPKNASKIGKENRRLVETRFRLDSMVDKILEVYQDCLDLGQSNQARAIEDLHVCKTAKP